MFTYCFDKSYRFETHMIMNVRVYITCVLCLCVGEGGRGCVYRQDSHLEVRIQYTVCSIQYTVYSIQYTLYSKCLLSPNLERLLVLRDLTAKEICSCMDSKFWDFPTLTAGPVVYCCGIFQFRQTG